MGNLCQGASTRQAADEARIQESLDSLFPDFKPLTKDSDKWQQMPPTHCPECCHEFDFLMFHEHCRSCGKIFCSRCCYVREAIKHHPICGLCMGGAMRQLREQELNKIHTRMRTYSQLQRQHKEENKEDGPVEMGAVAGHPAAATDASDNHREPAAPQHDDAARRKDEQQPIHAASAAAADYGGAAEAGGK